MSLRESEKMQGILQGEGPYQYCHWQLSGSGSLRGKPFLKLLDLKEDDCTRVFAETSRLSLKYKQLVQANWLSKGVKHPTEFGLTEPER